MKKNTFIPLRLPLVKQIRWWRKQSIENDKGGSFNVELYLAYCEAKFE
jgi:hypothetical protein